MDKEYINIINEFDKNEQIWSNSIKTAKEILENLIK